MARRFKGQDEVRIDAKGRLSIPARFRRVFEAGDPDFPTRGRPQLVMVWGRPEWDWIELYTVEAAAQIDALIDAMPRGTNERLLLESIHHGAADEAEIDADGRIVLPQRLRDKIGLDDTAFFIAAGDYLKLWNPATYAKAGAGLEDYVASLGEGFDPRALLPHPEAPGP